MGKQVRKELPVIVDTARVPKYTDERIEELVRSQVRFWRYDKSEDVFMNCWTVSNHGNFGFFPNMGYKPEYKTKEDAEEAFRSHLKKL